MTNPKANLSEISLASWNYPPFLLDAQGLTQTVGRGQILLNNISLTIQSEEFVGIVGVSGAGKTTLLNALSGYRPAKQGKVYVNGQDLYKNFSTFRAELGYVPQDDIIHQDLTVYQAFDFSAQLRLSPSLSGRERTRQIQSVLADLELTHRQHTLVRKLSGGQRKRVSIGVELLTKPRLFFLDEATSGLDPGTEYQLMLLLRRLADEGRIVLLNTHTTKNIKLCDKVAFLAKGGRLVYFGPPADALEHFSVDHFDEIYIRIDEELAARNWQKQYFQSSAYQKYVVEPQKNVQNLSLNSTISTRKKTGFIPKIKSNQLGVWLRQLAILSHRNLTLLLQDHSSLILTILVAPMLGGLDLLMVRRNIFDPWKGDSGQSLTLMFIACLIAVLTGSLATMREIVKESEIYRRERMIGLYIIPYILSKIWLCIVIAVYQSAIFWVTKIYLVELPNNGVDVQALALYFTLFLSTLGGMIMGLLISSLSASQNAAPLLTILFLVPQITFAGAIFPLTAFGPPGLWISRLTLTRWSYESMVTLSGLGQNVANDPCWQRPEEERQSWSESEKESCQCLGPHLFERCTFPGLHKEFDPAVDRPEPIKPNDLAEPPQTPDSFFGPEAETFRDDLEVYRKNVKIYKQEMEQWRQELSSWQEQRGKALAAGEALITRVHRTQGQSFGVDVRKHWGRLAALISGMLGLLVFVQRQKDIL
ncbi:ABC transporter ATP-binding protein/permease [Lyngbya confervoides]|uniref:ATP-binding cassette domain-containing protein n=1 Tax=Lyngbya confervoides BDU141951 TaxID=1574623 RepID=A0ABD4T916_9CYAN|nr:ATP-binding cassette domain-containing protein [Lyngbya confervoides]MCM1984975.1 ATP-binding cassette domain-containing protein [Lyngbya confervoides BDU141951]